MRSLLYVVICTVGLACVTTPALANKAQSPQRIVLELNESVVSGQSLTLNTSMSAGLDFYRGSVKLLITSADGTPIGDPIEVFKGGGEAGFNSLEQVKLPALAPGRYRVQGLFTSFLNKSDLRPTISGSNLYLDVREKQVLSSNVSFAQIKREELKAQMLRLGKTPEDMEVLQQQNPKLFEAVDAANRIQAITVKNQHSLVAQPGSSPAVVARKAEKPAVGTIAIGDGQLEEADPRKAQRKAARWDFKNAVVEKQEIDQ